MIKYLGIALLLCQISNAESQNIPIHKNTREISSVKLLQYANSFIGCSYKYGQKRKQKIDCSGFVQEVFTHFGILLPRSVYEQSHVGRNVDFKNIQKGDLLFFSTRKSNPSHVAIYLGDRKIIHASYAAKCIHCDDIDKAFFRKNFLFAKRLFNENKDSIGTYDNLNNKLSIHGTVLDTSKKIIKSDESILHVPQKIFRNYQLFEGRDIIISEEGKENLCKWVQQFKSGYYKSVTINVYTDNVPPKFMRARFATNLILSTARAKMISDYLILLGLDPHDVQANGMGDTNSLSSNDTADGQSKNRRVEFIF